MHLPDLSGCDAPSRRSTSALLSAAAASGATGPSLLVVSVGACLESWVSSVAGPMNPVDICHTCLFIRNDPPPPPPEDS